MTSRKQIIRQMFGDRLAPDGSLVRENFSKWFGRSKIVDDEKKPRVVYHGTDTKFSMFSLATLGTASGTSDARTGFWFTSDYARAQDAACDAKMANESSEYWVMPVYLHMQNPFIVHDSLRKFEPQESARLIDRAKLLGCDGVIFVVGEGKGSDFVVFKPSQIKSATNNCGCFDPDSNCSNDSQAFVQPQADAGSEMLRERMRA